MLRDEDGKARFFDILDAFVVGAKYAISVGAAAATVGIIIGIVTLTGVGFKLSTIITGAAADMATLLGERSAGDLFDIKAMTLFFTLVMTAIVCILLGCGMPTTANYLIMVTIAAPALAMLGVPQLVSHFFVFYYGVLADITPPVALAAYAGASMAGADPFKTGNTAFRLGPGEGAGAVRLRLFAVDAAGDQGLHLGRILRNHDRLRHRRRHARRRPDRLWPRAHAAPLSGSGSASRRSWSYRQAARRRSSVLRCRCRFSMRQLAAWRAARVAQAAESSMAASRVAVRLRALRFGHHALLDSGPEQDSTGHRLRYVSI